MELLKQQPGERIASHEVAVIGSGIAGCLAARALALEGFAVSVLEERTEAFSGTSAYAIQAHLGGLYSGSIETAKECLRSAIELKKEMPFSLNDMKTRFLVADKSLVSLDEYTEFYQELADYYADLDAADHVFGHPAEFFRILEPFEFGFAKNIEGGIATKEPGLDMARTRRVLLGELDALGVRMRTATEVTNVSRKAGKFILQALVSENKETLIFDQVVNAGGYKARLLDDQLGDQTVYNLYLKTWNLVRNSDNRAPLAPFYVVRGDFMHYTPFGDDGLISLITATNDGSYLDTMRYQSNGPELPSEWADILTTGNVPDKSRRQQTIIEYAKDEFLMDAKFTPIDLIPGVAVSYSASRNDRTRRGVNTVVPGWQTIVPTKATNALELARETRDGALQYLEDREYLS